MARRGIKYMVLIATLALCVASGGYAADIEVNVSLDRDTIGMDEQAMLEITVSGNAQNLPDPQMPTLSMFEIYSQGRSSSISIVNGQVNSSLTFRYLLLPTKAGTFPISNIAVVFQNKRYKGNTVELTVLSSGVSAQPKLSERAADDSGKSRDHFLEAVVDKKSCYVNEQVTLSLKYYVAVRTYGSPELTEPTTTGFWTEVLGNKPPYYQKINGRNYKVIERKYALFPTQTGELTIGRASIRATAQLRSRQFRDPFDAFGDLFGRGEEITDRSQPITVNVKPLPEKGRPKDFTGTIGRFEISADLNKRETEVNQPVSLTIKIRGTGNIKSVAEPEVGDLPDFRVYRASSSENISKQNDRIGGTKIYEEVFIPKRPGRLEIPAITFNYFDPNRGKYIVTSTKPITLNVTKPEGYVASAEVPFVTPDMTIGSEARNIRFIRDDIGDLTPVGSLIVFRPLFLAINGLPVVLLAGMVVARRRREKLAADTGYARSRGASKVAKKRLARARSLAKVEHTEQFYAEIYQALTSYIADKLNISPHGLTTERINELLAQRSASEELTAGVDNVIRKCDFARYASSSITADDIDQSLAEAERIITAMEAIRFA